MLKIKGLVLALALTGMFPAVAQQNQEQNQDHMNAMAAPRQIQGTIVSFSGYMLDIQPPASSRVWVTIPGDMKVDRSALKEGASVSVQARWATVCYVATEPPHVGS